MCKSSAARRLTEAITIKKEGKILILVKTRGKDFAIRASSQVALISELTLLPLNIGLGVSFQALIIVLRTRLGDDPQFRGSIRIAPRITSERFGSILTSSHP
jgi:hypothetical protein